MRMVMTVSVVMVMMIVAMVIMTVVVCMVVGMGMTSGAAYGLIQHVNPDRSDDQKTAGSYSRHVCETDAKTCF